ncbi:AMP-binding protein [Streptomyces sp. NPDC056503]|uniref:AMP-binding protein n=1 Tax=Streptomyces sp. NPDC056503 TaxID=3345842 RepID=UPI00367A965A
MDQMSPKPGTNGNALYSRFLKGLALDGDAVALRAGGHSVTYREAHRTALHRAGAVGDPARPVAVLASPAAPDAALDILAALAAGATVVPLNAEGPPARTARTLAASGARTVFADAAGLRALERLPDRARRLAVHAPAAAIAGTPGVGARPFEEAVPLDAPRPVRPDDAAYILFTSGSTGRPKGVPITHRNATHYFAELDGRYAFVPGDVFSQTFDLNFDCALFDLFCAWGSGARVTRIPPHAYRDLPAHLADEGVTVWFSTPSAIALTRRTGRLAPGVMPGLRHSFFAGEALGAQDAADWQAAAPGSVLENLYGPTELTVTIARYRWSPATSPDRCVNGGALIGRVHDGHRTLLLAEDGTPADDEGELCVSGPQTTPGYLDPADDEGRFLEHDGHRYYRTGDRVRRTEDGDLAYLGRLDTQVQVHGHRVELAEIDHLLRAGTAVEQAVTVAVQGGPTDTAELVVFYTGTPVPPVELARALRAALPGGTIPRHFGHLAALPLNANRKIDRLALTARARELLRPGTPA